MTQSPPPTPPDPAPLQSTAELGSSPPRYCWGCVYPVTGLDTEAGNCPECGRDFDLRRPLSTRAWPRADGAERGRTLVVWFAIVLLVAGIAVMQHMATHSAVPTGALPSPEKVGSPFIKALGKTGIGIESLSKGSGFQMLSQLDEASTNVIDELRSAGLAGWIAGSDEAITRLDSLDAKLATQSPPEPELQEDAKLMRAIFLSPDGTLEPSAEQRLLDRHAWFGRVALAAKDPPGSPERKSLERQGLLAAFTLLAAGGIIVVANVLGIIALVVMLVQYGSGSIRMRFPWDQAHFEPTRGTMLETIAIFLGGFIVLNIVAASIQHFTNIDSSRVLMWGLLLIAGWPVARQLQWRQTRLALGWHTGRGVAREMGAGIIGYLAGLPIVMLSFVIALVLTAIVHQKPTHPVVDELGQGSAWTLIMTFILATVWAPVVEETMFRGAFYSHLRRVANPIIAAFSVGFVFAIIHPQGITLVPPLMTLGAVFALIREWRGSLIGSMTAHAIHNGFLVTMMAVLFS